MKCSVLGWTTLPIAQTSNQQQCRNKALLIGHWYLWRLNNNNFGSNRISMHCSTLSNFLWWTFALKKFKLFYMRSGYNPIPLGYFTIIVNNLLNRSGSFQLCELQWVRFDWYSLIGMVDVHQKYQTLGDKLTSSNIWSQCWSCSLLSSVRFPREVCTAAYIT